MRLGEVSSDLRSDSRARARDSVSPSLNTQGRPFYTQRKESLARRETASSCVSGGRGWRVWWGWEERERKFRDEGRVWEREEAATARGFKTMNWTTTFTFAMLDNFFVAVLDAFSSSLLQGKASSYGSPRGRVLPTLPSCAVVWLQQH